MCNWFQNKSTTQTFAVDWDTWHVNWVALCYFNGASPTESPRWGHGLQGQLVCEGLYGDFHVKDKTVARPSYLQHVDPYTGKLASLYWDGPPWLHLCDNKEKRTSFV